jgi:hypothetical protein
MFDLSFQVELNWNLRLTILELPFDRNEIALLIPLARVRPRRTKSYIPGTIIGAADR